MKSDPRFRQFHDNGDPAQLMEADPWSWTYYNKLRLAGGRYMVYGHEFQRDIFQSTDRRQCAKKSPQMGGFTEILIIRALHGMRYGHYPQGVVYMFPTEDEVTTFSKSRFKPFLSNNQKHIGRFVKETNASDVKRIGNAFLFFVGSRLKDIQGAQKSSSKLKSKPADAFIADELDEMDMDAIDIVKGRMDHSLIKEEFYLANPTVPNYGIDKLYQGSDQRVWTMECAACGRETVLELEFPNCLHRLSYSNVSAIRNSAQKGNVIRICRKCEREVDPRKGYWIAQYPDKAEDMVGWWISHLSSMYTDPKDILDEYENPETDLVRFHNRRLGMAYVKAEDQLTINDVMTCCGSDPMLVRDSAVNCLGADVGGNELHVIIANKISDVGLKVVKIARVPDFNALWDLCTQFNVKSAVMDLKPEIHSVREFCNKAPFSAFGCDYSEETKGITVWNDASKVVTVNRTEIFDGSHKQITISGRTELPRIDDEIKEFAKQMIATVKTLEDKKAGGNVIGKVYRYKKIGAEHYRNAMNYLLLAAQRAPIVQRNVAAVVEEKEFYYG